MSSLEHRSRSEQRAEEEGIEGGQVPRMLTVTVTREKARVLWARPR